MKTELKEAPHPTGVPPAPMFIAAIFLMIGCSNPSPSDQGSGAAGTSGAGAGGSESFACPGDAAETATIPIPGGAFIMGCNMAVDQSCKADENPMRTVTLMPFEIERTEVTQGRYAACVAEQKCSVPSCAWNCADGTVPATCITRDQAQGYCAWAGRRLPTEAEWELAARGTDGRKYPWGNDEPDCTRDNLEGCSGKIDPVGQRPDGASPYGALDMSGNVVEMVADWYDDTYYQAAPTTDPTGPAMGTRYTGRGGGYKSASVWQRASARDWYDVSDTGSALGFRCAR